MKKDSKFIAEYCEDGLSDDTTTRIIMEAYVELFEADRKEPSVTSIFNKIEYDYEAKGYDIIYGLDKTWITQDNIARILIGKGCVVKWGGFLCACAKQIMFDDLYEELTGLSYDKDSRQGLLS